MTLATKHLQDALTKYGTIYPETLQLAETQERINLIQAYFAGAMAMQKNDVDVDAFLNNIDESNHNIEEIMTIDEASDFLSINKPDLYVLVHRLEIPFCKKNNRLYFIKSCLKKWSQNNKNIINND